MKKQVLSILLLVALVSVFWITESGRIETPKHFPKPAYDFSKNPLNEATILLGRVLFYDPILSKDTSTSCASCHSPYNAFAHTDHDLSHGINDEIGHRNAPALFNLAWQKSFMWDGAINHLDMQPLAPINHPKEMGETTGSVIDKLQKSELYPELFYKAFGDKTITGELFLKALAQFQLTLVSADSRYDQVQKGEATFTEKEQNGYQLFQQHCNSCHTEPMFTNFGFANNGLAVDTTLNDFGKWTVTKQSQDSLLFKIPSLRNLSYSYPYMHDGRFKKLREVLDHYTDGIRHSPTLAPQLQNSIVLSSNEKTDLVIFLLTLDDKSFVFNPEHQFPREILLK